MKTNLMSVSVTYNTHDSFEVEAISYYDLFNEIQERTNYGLDEEFDEYRLNCFDKTTKDFYDEDDEFMENEWQDFIDTHDLTEEQYAYFINNSSWLNVYDYRYWDDQLEMFVKEGLHDLEEYQSEWANELEYKFKRDDEINQEELFDKAYEFVEKNVTELFGVEDKEKFFDEFKEFVKGE